MNKKISISEVYIGTGSNLGDRSGNLDTALGLIAEYPLKIDKVSSVFISSPWGFRSDNDFFNQVIGITTSMEAYDLLDMVWEIETGMGRKRTGKGYSDRIIDIDILFYGSEIISFRDLVIPHPLLHERMFVLQPMAEIVPEFIHPVLNKTIAELLSECS